MKRMAWSIAVASVAMLVGACGGRTFDGVHTDDGGNGGSDGGGDGGTCMPLPGCRSNTSCPAGDGCNACTCTGGAWGCTLLACVDASTTCPPSPPAIGSYCQDNRLQCTFGTPCGPEFICRNNAWAMVIRTCPPPPPPACPPSPPSGSCNGEVGLSCSWGSGCSKEMCDCVATPGGPTWECSGTACVDAGHTGDGGH